jgi:hypothetical protein
LWIGNAMLNHHHSLKMQGNAYDMTGGEQHYEFMSTFLDAYGNELAPHSGDPVHQGSGHQNNMTGAYNLSQNGHHFGGSNGSYDNFIPQQYHGQYGNSHGMMGDYHQQLYGGSGSSGGPGNSQTSGTSSSGSGNSSGSSSSGSGNAASSNPYGVGGYMIQFSFSANSSLHFSWGVIWDFASFGCQFGTEVWLLAMLIACAHANVHYLRQLSLAIVLVRTAHAFPSLFVFWRLLCVPNSVWSQQLQQPRRLAHKCGIFLLSLLALGNGMLLRYLTVVSRQQVSWIPR